jgi:metallo-beta-lactamase class B
MRFRLLPGAALFTAAAFTAYAQAPAPVTPEALITAAKRAAGTDHAGTFLRICVAPDNLNAGGRRGGGPGPRVVPDRSTWYAKPYKVFDNLYFIGTRIHSAWALTTSAGIIVIDTLFDYAIEPEMIEGMTILGLDPRDIKYVLISHAHGDHDQGAARLQSRYGAKIVMGAADWDATLQRNASAPSYFFPVKDAGRTLIVTYSGGTAFNFPRQAATFAIYRDSQRRMGEVAEAAGATVLMSNHTEFDRAYDRVRIAQLPRSPGERHPYETDTATVLRYFEMAGNCAEAQRLLIQ